MKKSFHAGLVLGCLFVGACCLVGCVQQKASCADITPSPKHVIFIGFDGLAGWCVKAHPEAMPTLNRLMREGAWSLKSRSILPSSSACNWHSIFTCSASEQHGFNNWGTQTPVFAPSALKPSGLYPDVFAELREQRPSADIRYLYCWPGMSYVADTNACDYVRNASDESIAKFSEKIIRDGKTDFLAAVFHEPDGAGHHFGWGSPEYVKAMQVLDEHLAKLIRAIEEKGLRDDTIVVIASDHGGTEKKHGGPTLREMERTLVVWGKGVKENYELKTSTASYDVGATLAALLDLRFPQAWIGRPILEAFK